MSAEDAPADLYCPSCTRRVAFREATATCPDCDGLLRLRVDPAVLPDDPTEGDASGGSWLAGFTPLFGTDLKSIDLGAGGTTPIECPSFGPSSEGGTLWIADEGVNPTGSAADREMVFAIAAALDRDADGVVLPSTGHAAQSAAAHAGRAGLAAHAFVPSRTPFLNKAMTNVHGGELSVVEGRYSDALAAYESADRDGFPVDPASPPRRLGAVTLAWDLLSALEWSPPDAIAVPAAHGHRIAGLESGLRAAVEAGLIGTTPRLYAAQPEGCAPIVRAQRSGLDLEAVAGPDSVVGPLEVPRPVLGSLALGAIEATDGGAIEVTDEAALAAGVEANASAGIECSATGGVALAGLQTLREQGEIGPDESVLVVDPLSAAAESDVLRSHLMSRGV